MNKLSLIELELDFRSIKNDINFISNEKREKLVKKINHFLNKPECIISDLKKERLEEMKLLIQ